MSELWALLLIQETRWFHLRATCSHCPLQALSEYGFAGLTVDSRSDFCTVCISSFVAPLLGRLRTDRKSDCIQIVENHRTGSLEIIGCLHERLDTIASP